ncbi:hypothetical protein N7462_008511 [Penicillium macrosclerotiorum]|uniref:uncharacterized protein n=1 Tax=Penicillium macrosclerotiorum TaxID=303699 RepID=UPI00254827BA|nr:uncharacterized protein N7462_008511 [Penicillium macrosclerotiorum]KAJ5675614.1 hypothetical protein N7462_008511 [Penicillium macrosclerotiorum]
MPDVDEALATMSSCVSQPAREAWGVWGKPKMEKVVGTRVVRDHSSDEHRPVNGLIIERMVYYIRFLKTPRFQQQKKSVFISALICITTDLGDDFLAEDVDLVATWIQHSSQKVRYQAPLQWQAGSRQLSILLGPFSSNDVARQTAVLKIQLPSVDKDTLGDNTTPLVISGSSAPFGPQWEPAEKLIQRDLNITGNVRPLKIWEETGNSIARHIWDAALASIIFLEKVITGTEKSMPALSQLMGPRSAPLQVVELGAGCGIVGIALATMLSSCEVLLTDLPEVEDIVTRNIQEATPKASASIRYQTLDWDNPPPKLCNRPIDLILVSDCTYNADSLPTLVSVLDRLVRTSPDALVLVALKRRHESEVVFFDLMRNVAFEPLQAAIELPASHEEVDQIELYCYRRTADQGDVS